MSELRIMEYQGKYRIESGRQDGEKWWADKIRRKVWDKGSKMWVVEEKDRNFSLPLGDIENARGIIKEFVLALGIDMAFKKAEVNPQPTEDVPF